MYTFRSAAMLAALLISTPASAGVQSFSFNGNLSTELSSNLIPVYSPGMNISGNFAIDDAISGVYDYPGRDYRNYYGALSGSVNVDGNTLKFGNSIAHVYRSTSSGITSVTLLGGNGWRTGGWISETRAPAGFAVQGFQIRFDYMNAITTETPIATILNNYAANWTSLFLHYGLEGQTFHGNWGNVTALETTDIPEPDMGWLMLASLLVLAAVLRKQRAK